MRGGRAVPGCGVRAGRDPARPHRGGGQDEDTVDAPSAGRRVVRRPPARRPTCGRGVRARGSCSAEPGGSWLRLRRSVLRPAVPCRPVPVSVPGSGGRRSPVRRPLVTPESHQESRSGCHSVTRCLRASFPNGSLCCLRSDRQGWWGDGARSGTRRPGHAGRGGRAAVTGRTAQGGSPSGHSPRGRAPVRLPGRHEHHGGPDRGGGGRLDPHAVAPLPDQGELRTPVTDGGTRRGDGSTAALAAGDRPAGLPHPLLPPRDTAVRRPRGARPDPHDPHRAGAARRLAPGPRRRAARPHRSPRPAPGGSTDDLRVKVHAATVNGALRAAAEDFAVRFADEARASEEDLAACMHAALRAASEGLPY